MFIRSEIKAWAFERFVSASYERRSSIFSCEEADYAIVLLSITKIGSPGAGDTLTASLAVVDESDNPYYDADSTFGTVVITGSTAQDQVAIRVPYLGERCQLVVKGSAGLSSSTGFVVDARVVLVGNTDEL